MVVNCATPLLEHCSHMCNYGQFFDGFMHFISIISKPLLYISIMAYYTLLYIQSNRPLIVQLGHGKNIASRLLFRRT